MRIHEVTRNLLRKHEIDELLYTSIISVMTAGIMFLIIVMPYSLFNQQFSTLSI